MTNWMGDEVCLWSSRWSINEDRELIQQADLMAVVDYMKLDNARVDFLWMIAT